MSIGIFLDITSKYRYQRKLKKKIFLAPERIELTTFALLARRSNQLSYGASWPFSSLNLYSSVM